MDVDGKLGTAPRSEQTTNSAGWWSMRSALKTGKRGRNHDQVLGVCTGRRMAQPGTDRRPLRLRAVPPGRLRRKRRNPHPAGRHNNRAGPCGRLRRLRGAVVGGTGGQRSSMTTLDIGWHYSRMEGAAQSQTGGLWHRQDRSPRRHGTRQVDCRRVEVSVQRGPGCGRTLLGLLAVLSAALRSVFAASQNPAPPPSRAHARCLRLRGLPPSDRRNRPRTGPGGGGPGGAGDALQRDRRRQLDEQHQLVEQRGPLGMARGRHGRNRPRYGAASLRQ